MSAPVPVLFVDRDGTLIAEPDDFQIDAFENLFFGFGRPKVLLFFQTGKKKGGLRFEGTSFFALCNYSLRDYSTTVTLIACSPLAPEPTSNSTA